MWLSCWALSCMIKLTRVKVDQESVDKSLYESCIDSHWSRSNEDESWGEPNTKRAKTVIKIWTSSKFKRVHESESFISSTLIFIWSWLISTILPFPVVLLRYACGCSLIYDSLIEKHRCLRTRSNVVFSHQSLNNFTNSP